MNGVINSLTEQSRLGLVVCIIIILTGILGCVISWLVAEKYKKLCSEFNNSEVINLGERNFNEASTLRKIENEFKKSVDLNISNINTEVVIQKNLQEKLLISEGIISIIPSILIALGLIGTFLGLTLAIVQTTGVLSAGTQSMSDFSKSMNGPLSSMSSAFWTSIFGVVGSMIINLFNVNMKRKKEGFYDIFEDYLDNVIFGIYFKSEGYELNKIIKDSMSELIVNMETSMIDITKDMRTLFKNGVRELVKGINKNTLDLTDTVKELTNYTKDLDRLTSSLNKSVENFKNPVDKFKTSIYEFTNLSDEFTSNMRESVNKFAEKVDRLDSSLNTLHNVLDGNQKELNLVSNFLKEDSENLKKNYTAYIDAIESIDRLGSRNNEEFLNQVNKLNDGYNSFGNGLNQFMDGLERLQKEIGNSISNTLKNEMESLSENIVEKLNVSLNDIRIATQQLSKNTLNIGELTKATNEWIAAKEEMQKLENYRSVTKNENKE